MKEKYLWKLAIQLLSPPQKKLHVPKRQIFLSIYGWNAEPPETDFKAKYCALFLSLYIDNAREECIESDNLT